VVTSFLFFFPDVVITDALPLTGGLAAVCLFAVLLVKLMGDPDHHLRDFRLVTSLLGLGAVFYFVPYLFGVQFNAVAPAKRAGASNFLVTTTNPNWAVGIGYASTALLAILGAVAAAYVLRTGGRAEAQDPAAQDTASTIEA
jgi:hypothetical protein